MSSFVLGVILFCVAGREVSSSGWMVWKSAKTLATRKVPMPDGKAEDFATKITGQLILSAATTVFCVLAGMRLI